MATDIPRISLVNLYTSHVPEHLERVFTVAAPDPAGVTLARALLTSPAWSSQREAVIVVRTEPTPIVAAIGRFDAEDEARLRALHDQLRTLLPRTIYLDYRAVEAACERLATRFRERFDHGDILRMRFTGVPRGGLIVLGMLAYALGLPRHQVAPFTSATELDGPVVFVDDSLVSGTRLAPYLAERGGLDTVVATLYSHPDLRAAMRRRYSHVTDIVSAHDLHDHAPTALGSEYEAWRCRWEERSHADELWIGQPDHVCFPWSEPSTSSWNAVTRRAEAGWRVIPPELCLKNRFAHTPEGLSVQIQQPGKGLHRPAGHIVYGETADEVVIGNLETLQVFALRGIAADMWWALVECEDESAVVDRIAHAYDIDRATLLSDTREFVGELLAARLVEPVSLV